MLTSLIQKEIEFPEEPLCNTCKNKIDFFPFRHIFLDGKNNVSQVLFFHYFFPCWDPQYVIQNYPKYPINQAGFTFDSKNIPEPDTMSNYKKNIELWIQDGY